MARRFRSGRRSRRDRTRRVIPPRAAPARGGVPLLVRYPLLVLSVALALAATGNAHHCTTWSTSQPEVDLTPLGIGWYIDNDLCQPECVVSVWPYPESNGIPGLQRGDEMVDDTCHGMIDSDGWLSP